jgi:hypothetical protein
LLVVGAFAVSKNRVVRWFVVAVAVLLSVCAGIGPVPAQTLQGIRRIGIISAIGEKFDVRKVGLTVFGNELTAVPIAAWGIDDLVTAKARALLSRRFDVRPVKYQRAAFAGISNAGSPLSNAVRSAASSDGVDAYVVLMGNVSQFGTTNQYVGGLGIVTSGLIPQSVVHALYSVTVIDAHQFNQIGFASASRLDQSLGAALGFGECFIHGPCHKVEPSMVPASPTPADVAKLKGIIVQMIEQSLPDTLHRAQLVD